MKSDEDISIDVFLVIKGSVLEASVSGVLTYDERPKESDLEDIIISILDNNAGQIQEAFVNVNIYVPDVWRDSRGYVKNKQRVMELCDMAIDILEVYNGGDFRFEIVKQRVHKVNGKNEHFINNKLLYRQNNEIV